MSRKAPIIIVAGIVVVLMCVFFGMSRSGRRALRGYEAELQAKGEKLTLAELAIPPSTNPEFVASRDILATNGALPGGRVLKLMQYVGPGRARVAWRGELRVESPVRMPSNNTNIPVLEWAALDLTNAAVAAQLELLKTALDHPTPDSGWVYADTVQNVTNGPPRTAMRDRVLAESLVRAAVGELHRGNLAGAISDLHALAGLTEVNRNDLTLVSGLVRSSIAKLGLAATWEALAAPGWDEQRLAGLQQDWERMNLVDSLERVFLGERAYGRVMSASVRSASGKEFAATIPYQPTISFSGIGAKRTRTDLWFTRVLNEQLIPITYRLLSADKDEMLQLTHYTKQVELVRMLKANRPWPEVSLMQSNVMQDLTRTFDGDHFHRYLVSARFIPNLTKALQNTVRMETMRRLAVTAIAVKRYELRHGQPPPNLAALVPEFLAAVPIDPMSGKALCCRLNGDATVVLYSTGEDGVDNGGVGGTDLWQGPDAVWPAAEP